MFDRLIVQSRAEDKGEEVPKRAAGAVEPEPRATAAINGLEERRIILEKCLEIRSNCEEWQPRAALSASRRNNNHRTATQQGRSCLSR
jgi:hypothetical protein